MHGRKGEPKSRICWNERMNEMMLTERNSSGASSFCSSSSLSMGLGGWPSCDFGGAAGRMGGSRIVEGGTTRVSSNAPGPQPISST